MKNLKSKLKDIIKKDPTFIKAEVAKEALNYSDDKKIISFFNDLLFYGCASGIIPSLMSCNDTHKFYDDHYNEIEGIRINSKNIANYSMNYDRDLKNFLVWNAFEETACNLINEIE